MVAASRGSSEDIEIPVVFPGYLVPNKCLVRLAAIVNSVSSLPNFPPKQTHLRCEASVTSSSIEGSVY